MRNIVITGASSGIGAALVERYAAPGVTLALIARDADRLAYVKALAEAKGAKVEIMSADVRDGAALAALLAAFDAANPIDLLIANAGIFDGRKAGEDVEDAATSLRVLETNLTGAINTVQAALPGMRARKSGRIALVASLAGLTPLAGALGYSASKAAMVAYGLGLNQALYKDGIAVSVICPGFVDTPIAQRHVGWQPFRLSAAQAAEKIERAIARKKALAAFPLPLHMIARPSVLMPEFVRRFAGRFFACHAASPALATAQTPLTAAEADNASARKTG